MVASPHAAGRDLRRHARQQGAVGAAPVEFMKDTPMYQLYQRVAPRPEDFGRLLDKIGASMAKDFDFTRRGSRAPGPDDDRRRRRRHGAAEPLRRVFELLDGGQRDGGWMGEGRPAGGHALAVIPNATHYNVVESPVLAAAALTFLDAPRD